MVNIWTAAALCGRSRFSVKLHLSPKERSIKCREEKEPAMRRDRPAFRPVSRCVRLHGKAHR